MRSQATWSVSRTRTQAIPMAAYRRQLLLAQLRPRLLVLLAAAALYPIASSPWIIPQRQSLPTSAYLFGAPPRLAAELPAAISLFAEAPTFADAPASEASPVPDAIVAPQPPPPLSLGSAPVTGIGTAAITNIGIAIEFLDGVVIEPGAQLSFDDTARTWDYREDPRYVMGTATSVRGLIWMRGGGVCWLSTALWRAALHAGLRTDFREAHYGLVDALGGGMDATNTLVIRNDSAIPVTVRAWMDDRDVYVALHADGPSDRIATVRGPQRLGPGRYVTYQDVVWADGSQTTSEFVSRYFW